MIRIGFTSTHIFWYYYGEMIGIDIRGFEPKWWAGWWFGIGRTSKQLSRGFLVFLLIFTTSSSFFLRKMLVIVCDK